MSSKNQQGPSRLLDRYNLLRLVIHAPWSNGLDVQVLSAIIGQWYRGRETASISARQINRAIGHNRTGGAVSGSIRKLVAHDVVRIVRLGGGTRATIYALNLDLVKDGFALPGEVGYVARAESATLTIKRTIRRMI